MIVGIFICEKGLQICGLQEYEEVDFNLYIVIFFKDIELCDDQNEFVECLNKVFFLKVEGNKE